MRARILEVGNQSVNQEIVDWIVTECTHLETKQLLYIVYIYVFKMSTCGVSCYMLQYARTYFYISAQLKTA